MHIIHHGQMNLKTVAESGQCFRMNEQPDGSFLVQAGGRHVTVREIAPQRFAFSCTPKTYAQCWRGYFDLDSDYAPLFDRIDPADAFLQACLRHVKGLRILRQSPWETLVCFIISQRKSIPAIKGCVEGLCRAFGRPIGQTGLFAFPSPRALAAADGQALHSCALGYRAPYIQQTARMVAGGRIDLDALRAKSDGEIIEALCRLPGVGVKVANCVLLFGYHRLSAFPRDVWILRVEEAHYAGRFPEEKYPGYAGLLQQYMFCFGKSRAYLQWKEQRHGSAAF